MKCKFSLRSFVYGLTVMGIISFFMSPWPIWAYTQVVGKSTSGPIASVEEIEMLNGRISDVAAAVLKVGRVLETKLVQLTQVTAKEFEISREERRDQEVAAGVSREKMQNQRDFGASAKSIFSCASGGQAAAVSSGLKAEKGVSSVYYQTITKEGVAKNSAEAASEFYKELDSLEETSRENPGELLLPSTCTLSQEQLRDAKIVAKNITAGVADVKLADSQAQTITGVQYEAMRELKKQRLAVPQKALSDTLAYNTPAIEVGDWLLALLGEGNPIPDCLLVDNKISFATFFYLVSQSRVGNPKWMESIHVMTPTGLARESVMMQAVEIEQQRRIADSLNRITILLSQQVAGQTQEHIDRVLTGLRSNLGTPQ